MRKIVILFVVLVIGSIAALLYFLKPTHAPSPCQALTVQSPKKNEKVPKEFLLSTTVDNRNTTCHWTVFEGQAGVVEARENNGHTIGKGILQTTENWQTTKPTTYTAKIKLTTLKPSDTITLFIYEENPSGNPGQIISYPLQY